MNWLDKFIVSERGQWDHPGKPTAVPTKDGRITMQGVPYPLFAMDETGYGGMIYPGGNYQFRGNMVYEIPMAYGGDISIPDLSRPNWLDKYQKGQQVKYYGDLREFKIAEEQYEDSLKGFKKYPLAPYFRSQNISRQEFTSEDNPATSHFINIHNSGASILNSNFARSLNISPSNIRPTGNDWEWVYKKPTQKPVYKPKEYIPTKTVKLEREPIQLVMPQSDRTLMPYNNTMQVLRSIQKDDRDKQGPKVVPAPDFRHGGWLDKYQGDEQPSQVRRDPNQPFFESQTQPGTYEAQYSQPEVSISPNWTEEELKRNQLRDKYIADDKKVWRHWYDKLGYDKDNVTKRANQFAYNKLAKQYLKGDKDQLTEEQRKFIEKSEYANRLQPSIPSRFVQGITNPRFNLETLSNLAAPFEYPTNLVRGAVKGEFTDALIGQTPSPYFVSSDLAGTSPNEAAIASGLMDFGVDAGIGAIDVATPAYKGINALSDLRKTIGNSDFAKAITPFSKRKVAAQRDKLLEDWKDLTYNKMAEVNDEVLDAEQAAYKKQNTPSIKAYTQNKPYRSGPDDNAYETTYRKKLADKLHNTNLTDGLKLDNGDIIAEDINSFFRDNVNASPVLTSGSKEIVDLKSGNIINAKVDPTAFRSRAQLTTGPDGKKVVSFLDESAELPKINDDYLNTLQSNIQHIEETVPGAKVFGSSKGISEGNLPHLSSDYDVLISESDYAKNVKTKYPEKGVVGSAHKHDISNNPNNTNDDYVLDFNIIHENPDGTVKPIWIETGGGKKSSREIELFRQAFPEEFFEASKESILSGKPIKINKTANDLINRLDPAVKTIMDSYESTKTKHINRVDAYINYGDPRKVATAQESFVKSIVGGKGSVGHQFDQSAFSDVTKNKDILKKIDFVGDANAVSKDPARMQLALNDFYINSTVLTRGVDTNRLGDIKNVDSAFKNWNYQNPSGTLAGTGLNHVKLGYPFDLSRMDSNLIMGNKQIGLDVDASNIDNYIDSIVRQTDGNYILDNDELTVVKQLMDESFGPKVSKHFENKQNISTRDLISIHLDEPELYSDVVTGTNDYTNYHKFNQALEKNLGIRSVSGKPYGNSNFSATLSDFNESLDALGYAVNENMPTLKSANDRKRNFEFIQRRAKSIDSVEKTINSENFKLIEGYLNGGKEKAIQRIGMLAQEQEDFSNQIFNLKQKYAKKEVEKLRDLKRKLSSLNEESGKLAGHVGQLKRTLDNIDSIRKKLLIVGGPGVAVSAGVVAALPKDREELEKKLDKFFENFGVEPIQKKYGGWLDNYQDYNYIKYKDLSLSKGTGWLDNYK
jgi:hypothetical protein